MKKQYGNAFEISRQKNAHKNIVSLIDRTIASLKDPILESTASVFIIIITMNYLSLNSNSSEIMILIIIMQLIAIIMGFIVIAWVILRLKPYIDDIFSKQLIAEEIKNNSNN